MVEETQRSAYLRALGIEQWQPRAQPEAEPALESAELNPTPDEPAEVSATAVAPEPREPATAVVSAEAQSPSNPEPPAPAPAEVAAVVMPRDQLQDNLGSEALSQARVQWRSQRQPGARLAVLGIDATGPNLQPRDFEQEWGVLQKMLAAIGENLDACAVGGLAWDGEPSSSLNVPYALILVDSGADNAALINYWQDKLLTVQGARAVIAPHPAMFSQGVAMKRQAWASLQMLQQLWSE